MLIFVIVDKQAAFVGVDSTAVETSVVEAAFKLQGQDTGVRFSLLHLLKQSLMCSSTIGYRANEVDFSRSCACLFTKPFETLC